MNIDKSCPCISGVACNRNCPCSCAGLSGVCKLHRRIKALTHISGSHYEYKSLCNAIMRMGDLITHEPTTTNCHNCRQIYQIQWAALEAERLRPRTLQEKLQQWAYFGEGHYGALEWLATGIMTCGIGIPFCFIRKYIAKLLIKDNN